MSVEITPPRDQPTFSIFARRPTVVVVGSFVSCVAFSLAVLYVAWAHDIHNGLVVRNVSVAGREVGGTDMATLAHTVAGVAAQFASTPVRITTSDGAIDTTARALGISVDEPATIAGVEAVGHRSSVFRRPWRWLGSIIGHDRVAKVFLAVDRNVAEVAVRELEGTRGLDPVTPTVALSADGVFIAQPGVPGVGIDVGALIASVPRTMPWEPTGPAARPLVLSAKIVPILPPFDNAAAASLAEQANKLAATKLTIKVGAKQLVISPSRVRSWLMPITGPDSFALGIHSDLVASDLDQLFGTAGVLATDASVAITPAKQVTYIEGRPGTGCCADAPGLILNALAARNESPLELHLKVTEPSVTVEQLKALGIREVVGEFTTHQACCGNREYNIHHMADVTRGFIVMPGKTFTLNTFTGERRLDNGWKVAGGIEGNGSHRNQPGGGVSQYTTTLFNAVYRAGLPLEGMAHTVHFDRYPFGEEATLSYPHPDLIFTNNTPYAILIWNSYDDESVSVQLWSTRYAVGTTESITQVAVDKCIDWVNTRVVTYPDGHTAKNTYNGRYYPDGAQDCKGTPGPKYDDQGNLVTTTTTTVPVATTTTRPAASTKP